MADAMKYIKAAGRYVKDASEVGKRGGGVGRKITDTIHTPGRFLMNSTGDAARGVLKGMTKKTDPHFLNLYTGRRESGLGIAVASTAALGYAGYETMKQTTLAPKLGTVSYGGTSPVMDADGVGSTPQVPLTNAPTLGANGQMVFGLHQARRG